MAKIYYDKDIDLDPLLNLAVGVIGYGNQGRAHALNMRDSGLTVRVGTREKSAARDLAISDGFLAENADTIAANCDVLAIMVPDETVPQLYINSIEPYLSSNKIFVFAHGFTVHFETIKLPDDADILLVAPTGPGRQLRSLYQNGKGLPALAAVQQDTSGVAFSRCLAYAKAIGCGRAGIVETTFAEETVTDLFCEQTVLCGGVPELIKRSFDVLVNAGYQPELAYISCLKEVKLIADLLFDIGIDGMRAAISNTAKFGSAKAGPFLINDQTTHRLETVLQSIEGGQFAKDLLSDAAEGSPTIKNLLKEEQRSLIARTGNRLREELSF